jgi:hypothetical protein
VSVFVLKDPETLVALQPAEFAREDDFQQLLAKFPSLLSGGQAESADGVRPNRRSKVEESGWSFNKRNGRCQAGGDNMWKRQLESATEDKKPQIKAKIADAEAWIATVTPQGS